MRVVHVITGLGPGGAEGVLYRLCAAQASDKPAVISLIDEGVYGSKLRSVGVDVHTLGMSSSPSSVLHAFSRLRKFLTKEKPDLVQTWMYHADLIGGIAAWSTGIPVCWGIRMADPSEAGRSTRLVARICAVISGFVPDRAISCAVRGVSTHQSLGYVVGFDVVPNGVDLATWSEPGVSSVERDELGFRRDDFVVVHAARAHPHKDHATLAKAFTIAHERNPSLRLLLCGTGLEDGSDYFAALPFSASARRAVRALGARNDLPQLWRLADGFVLSSVVEGFPNVVAEAMASGLPCVVTDVGDAGEIVGNTGIVVPPSDPAALARALLELSALSLDDRAILGAAARLRVAEKFTLERMAEGFRATWKDVIRMGTP